MSAAKWAYEDFAEGATIDLGSKLVSADEIVEFASEFDAQPIHLDEEAGKASILGGLVRLGLAHLRDVHAHAVRRLPAQFDLARRAGRRLRQMEEAGAGRRRAAGTPDHPVQAAVADRKPSLGFVNWRAELVNQKGETVFEFQNSCMFLTREAAA